MSDLEETVPLRIPGLLPERNGWELEIGPGKGHYILSRAAEQPGWGFVAVEVKSRHCRLIRERAQRRGLENLVVLRQDARRLLPSLEPGGILDRVTIHCPDPWWKKRHRKRAVITPSTLDVIHRLLRPGGEIYILTDVFDRAAHILRTITEHPGLENVSPTGGLLEERITGCTSNREQRCLNEGLPVFRMLFRRIARQD